MERQYWNFKCPLLSPLALESLDLPTTAYRRNLSLSLFFSITSALSSFPISLSHYFYTHLVSILLFHGKDLVHDPNQHGKSVSTADEMLILPITQ